MCKGRKCRVWSAERDKRSVPSLLVHLWVPLGPETHQYLMTTNSSPYDGRAIDMQLSLLQLDLIRYFDLCKVIKCSSLDRCSVQCTVLCVCVCVCVCGGLVVLTWNINFLPAGQSFPSRPFLMDLLAAQADQVGPTLTERKGMKTGTGS